MSQVPTLNLSARAERLKPSPTLGMTARAKAMSAQGLDVVSFAAGEPDFPTPSPICEAAVEALQKGMTKYVPSRGAAALQSALAEKCQRENGFSVTPDQIVVSTGAKQSLFNAMQVLLGPGDEVVLFAPYWMTYADQAMLAGAEVKVVPTRFEDGFVPDPEAFRAALTPRSRMVVINSPCNPTGAMIPDDVLAKIVHIALEHGLWIVTDEIYERLTYGNRHRSVVELVPEAADQTVTVMGCSKSYSMTGWRIGFSIAPAKVTSAMANLQDAVTSNATTFAQYGAVAALQLPFEAVEGMRVEFQARRDLMLSELENCKGVRFRKPEGAFYVMVDVSSHFGGSVRNDLEMAEHLLDKAHVACVPGSVFQADGFLRLSYATNQENIVKGVRRIAEVLSTV